MVDKKYKTFFETNSTVELIVASADWDFNYDNFIKVFSKTHEQAIYLRFNSYKAVTDFRSLFNSDVEFFEYIKNARFYEGENRSYSLLKQFVLYLQGKDKYWNSRLRIIKEILDGDVDCLVHATKKIETPKIRIEKQEPRIEKQVQKDVAPKKVEIVNDEGEIQNDKKYEIFIRPKSDNDRWLAKYRGSLYFESREKLDEYCRKFKNEAELIEDFYDSHYPDMYYIVGGDYKGELKALFYGPSEGGDVIVISDIKYAPKKETGDKIDTSHIKSKKREKEDYDKWKQ